MPQLDISTYTSQIFWLLVLFAILYFVCIRVIIPKLTKIFIDRESYISNGLLEAENINNRALELEIENNKKISAAYFKAKEEMNLAMIDFENESQKMFKESEQKMIDLQKKSDHKLAILKENIQAETERLVNESSVHFLQELLKVQLDKDALSNLVSIGAKNNAK
jgi:F-type H+-transporting ATPase subunit b